MADSSGWTVREANGLTVVEVDGETVSIVAHVASYGYVDEAAWRRAHAIAAVPDLLHELQQCIFRLKSAGLGDDLVNAEAVVARALSP